MLFVPRWLLTLNVSAHLKDFLKSVFPEINVGYVDQKYRWFCYVTVMLVWLNQAYNGNISIWEGEVLSYCGVSCEPYLPFSIEFLWTHFLEIFALQSFINSYFSRKVLRDLGYPGKFSHFSVWNNMKLMHLERNQQNSFSTR